MLFLASHSGINPSILVTDLVVALGFALYKQEDATEFFIKLLNGLINDAVPGVKQLFEWDMNVNGIKQKYVSLPISVEANGLKEGLESQTSEIFLNFPPILPITLKRFTSSNGVDKKDTKKFEFPQEIVINSSDPASEYELYAVIVHTGTT